MGLNQRKAQAVNTSKLFQERSKKSLGYFSSSKLFLDFPQIAYRYWLFGFPWIKPLWLNIELEFSWNPHSYLKFKLIISNPSLISWIIAKSGQYMQAIAISRKIKKSWIFMNIKVWLSLHFQEILTSFFLQALGWLHFQVKCAETSGRTAWWLPAITWLVN